MKFNLALLTAMSLGALPAFAGPDNSKSAQPPVQPPVENPLGVTVTVGYDSDYVFRGVEFAKNLVSASIDYTAPINNIISVDLNAWYGSSAGDDAQPFAGGRSYEELDLAATVSAKLGPVTVGVKYTYYDYLGRAGDYVKDINEVGLLLGTTVAGIDLAAGAYYDDTARGYYFEYSASHTFAITDRISIVPSVLVSHATHYYGVEGGNNVSLRLSIPVKLTKAATLTPYVAGNLPFDSLKDNGEQSRVYGGVALSVSF